MSPELFDPSRFGLENARQTKLSDCYGLGMVVYEVLSGHIPFHQYSTVVVVRHVLKGQRPERPRGPEGARFTDDVWGVLERCWAQQPSERPSIMNVLQYFEEVSKSWTPPPPQMEADAWESSCSLTKLVKYLLSFSIHLSTEAFPAFPS